MPKPRVRLIEGQLVPMPQNCDHSDAADVAGVDWTSIRDQATVTEKGAEQ